MDIGIETGGARATALTVGTTSIQVCESPGANSKRQALVFTNVSTGTEVISLNVGPSAAVAGSGIVLNPGDTYFEFNDPKFEVWRGPVQAICSAATGSLAIYER